jgi:hypothetical protein
MRNSKTIEIDEQALPDVLRYIKNSKMYRFKSSKVVGTVQRVILITLISLLIKANSTTTAPKSKPPVARLILVDGLLLIILSISFGGV